MKGKLPVKLVSLFPNFEQNHIFIFQREQLQFQRPIAVLIL